MFFSWQCAGHAHLHLQHCIDRVQHWQLQLLCVQHLQPCSCQLICSALAAQQQHMLARLQRLAKAYAGEVGCSCIG